MRLTSTAVCLAFAMALSSTYSVRAEDPAAIRAQIEELEQELAKLKKEFSCASSGAAAASAAAAASREEFRITYLGTIMVPASQVGGSTAALAGVSGQARTVATTANPNVVSFDLNQARVVSNGSRFTTQGAGGLGIDLSALTAATGQNARISIPLSSLANSGASQFSTGTASFDDQALAVRVSGSAIRAAAIRLSAAERATQMAYPNHQVVNSANFTSGIYRGTQFTAAPSKGNPFVGRYLQTPDGQLNTVMPVGQQFIVLP